MEREQAFIQGLEPFDQAGLAVLHGTIDSRSRRSSMICPWLGGKAVPVRVLVFGDSITQGFWGTRGGWVDKLRQHYDELQLQDFSQTNRQFLILASPGMTLEMCSRARRRKQKPGLGKTLCR